MGALAQLADDPAAGRRLARDAVLARALPSEDPQELTRNVEEALASDPPPGRLWTVDGRAVGIGVWQPAGTLGLGVGLLYLEPGRRSVPEYREMVVGIRDRVGPIVFLPGGLAGLSRDEEAGLMTGLGFAPFGRMEMRFPADGEVPALVAPKTGGLRSARPEDEPALARLHGVAYGSQFDRFLFLCDPEPDRDAVLQMRDILGGTYGPFLPDDSTLVEVDGVAIGACLTVQRPTNRLIADVMVDPKYQGHGIGRAVLVGALRAIRDHGVRDPVLNVTLGNTPAVRLYESVGFRRSLGPSSEWYNTAIVPIAPGDGYALAPAGIRSSPTPSGA